MESLATPRRVSALGLLAASLLWGSVGLAQVDPDELARRHFESGAAYFEQAEYDEALTAFQKAYDLSGRHLILRNISLAQERLGNLVAAVAALDEFLTKEPDGESAETIRLRRQDLWARLEQQRQELGAQPAAPPEASGAPPDSRPQAAPGDRAASERASGLPAEESNLLLDEPNLAPTYILLSIGGLSAAGALLTGVVANIEYNELKPICARDGCSNSEIATGSSLALTSTILTGVSVLSVATGIVLWATTGSSSSSSDHTRTDSSSRPQVGFQWLPGAGYAEARIRF
ncbi:MAG: hypothetical protein RJA70_2790 [Pseudomonadota bacterium]